ncbi:hypothetical protein PFISCL1PPCAC_7997, partial [Pristionchus fissidentatus]
CGVSFRKKMIPILRDSTSSSLPPIPDDIFYQLLDCIGPVQFLHCGWDRVSRGFSSIFDRKLSLTRRFDFHSLLDDGFFDISCPSTSDFCLSFVVSRLWNVEEVIIPMSIMMRLVQSPDVSLRFPRLRSLKVLMSSADNCRIASSGLSFRERKTANDTQLFTLIEELTVEIEITDELNLPHAEFRRFAAFMKQSKTEWNLTLRDGTSKGQGWCPPCEIFHKREAFFVTYVRCLIDLGVIIDRLWLEESAGDSGKTIHMHHDYKKCAHLFVLYNIGFTASAIEETFPMLQSITIKQQPHAMLQQYFENAPSLIEMRILKEETHSENCH